MDCLLFDRGSVMLKSVTVMIVCLWISISIGQSLARQRNQARPRRLVMAATAYAQHGEQRAGTVAREGTAAADPNVLPLGTRVRVHGRKGYIGELVITDTGRKVIGRTLDIFFNTAEKAKRFGRQTVTVEVLEWGAGPASAREEVKEGLIPPRSPAQ
jgi:3D (Asp-Asp-Asp) domain-containing protein